MASSTTITVKVNSAPNEEEQRQNNNSSNTEDTGIESQNDNKKVDADEETTNKQKINTPEEETVATVPDTGQFPNHQASTEGAIYMQASIIFLVVVILVLSIVAKIKKVPKAIFTIDRRRKVLFNFLVVAIIAIASCTALYHQFSGVENVEATGSDLAIDLDHDLNLELTAGESKSVCGNLKITTSTSDGLEIKLIADGELVSRDQGVITNRISSISKSGKLLDNTWGVSINNTSGDVWQPFSPEMELLSIEEETPENYIVKICYGIKTSRDLAPGNYTTTVSYQATANISEKPVGIYQTNLNKQMSPKNLLVLLFNYNNGYYELDDEDIESQWADWIFGSGSIENGNASVNDYLKEVSKGNFYYNPILLGNNTTGVYSFHFDKDYSDEQGLHQEYSGFEHEYDMAQALSQLQSMGLDLSKFKAANVNNSNYFYTMVTSYDAPQSFRNPQWYSTDTILCVFPEYNFESVKLGPIENTFDTFSMYAHLNDTSNFGTVAHELLHTLGTIDIYNYGSYGADIMSNKYNQQPLTDQEYNTMHIDPYYKILFGWAEAKVISNSRSRLTLYPATSDRYNPVIIKTDDPNQYFILENRQPEGFDHGITIDNSVGINIWRVDGLSMEKIYHTDERKALFDKVLNVQSETYVPTYYQNKSNVDDATEVETNIKIKMVSKNEDGSITVSVDIP